MKYAIYETTDTGCKVRVVLRFTDFNEQSDTVIRVSEVVEIDFPPRVFYPPVPVSEVA